MNQFLNNKEGLRAEHQKQQPILEEEFIPSAKSVIEVTRLYGDGTMYFLKINGERTGKEEWGSALQITNPGMKKITNRLQQCCNLEDDDLSNGNFMGLIIWRILCNNAVDEVVTTIIPASKHLIFNEIQELLNHNIQTVGKD